MSFIHPGDGLKQPSAPIQSAPVQRNQAQQGIDTQTSENGLNGLLYQKSNLVLTVNPRKVAA